MINNKKGAVLYESTVEILFFVMAVLGFIVSIMSKSAVLIYVIVIIVAIMTGRVAYHRRYHLKFAHYFIIFGFLIGVLLGARYGNWLVIIILYIAFHILSYKLHSKGYLKKRH